jgi:hypothetical protein
VARGPALLRQPAKTVTARCVVVSESGVHVPIDTPFSRNDVLEVRVSPQSGMADIDVPEAYARFIL